MQKYTLANCILLLLNIAFVLLISNENIRFGNGLGDLFYFYILLLSCILLSVFIIFSSIKKHRTTEVISRNTTLVFTILIVYIFYFCTIGRGAEYPWNGKIFFAKEINKYDE